MTILLAETHSDRCSAAKTRLRPAGISLPEGELGSCDGSGRDSHIRPLLWQFSSGAPRIQVGTARHTPAVAQPPIRFPARGRGRQE